MKTTRKYGYSALLLGCAIISTTAQDASAALINVNFNGFTGGNPGPTQVESTLEGPGGGLGTSDGTSMPPIPLREPCSIPDWCQHQRHGHDRFQ